MKVSVGHPNDLLIQDVFFDTIIFFLIVATMNIYYYCSYSDGVSGSICYCCFVFVDLSNQ